MSARLLVGFSFLFASLLSATHAMAVSITLGFEGDPGSVLSMTEASGGLGCGAPGPLGQLTCSGTNLNNGGWTLDNWNVFADPDPTISNSFSITNNTASQQSIFVSISLPTSISFGPSSLIRGSIQGGATDNNGDGVTLSSTGLTSFYDGLIDGASVRTLLDASQLHTTPNAFDSVSVGLVNFGIPVQELIAVATNSTIGLTIRFDLTAGDSASFTSVFNVEPVPEPSTALLLGIGLAGLARVSRRASADS